MEQGKASELTQKLMALVEEKGGSGFGWPKKETLELLKKWQEELAAEEEKLSEALSKKDGLDLTEATAVLEGFANWQRDRLEEVGKWQHDLSALSKKRLAIEHEMEKIISQFEIETSPQKEEKISAVKVKQAKGKATKTERTGVAVATT